MFFTQKKLPIRPITEQCSLLYKKYIVNYYNINWYIFFSAMAKKQQGNNPATKLISELRALAEQHLLRNQSDAPDLSSSPEEMRKIIHELAVHQVELQMQQDELIHSRTQLEKSLDSYTDLYDFAPLGYITLNHDSKILEANLTASTILGVERSRLQGLLDLKTFIVPADYMVLDALLEKVFKKRVTSACEVMLLSDDTQPSQRKNSLPGRILRIDTSMSDNSFSCKAILSDITAQKSAENEIHRLNRALLATNKCNEALIHTSDEYALLQKICSLIVETGGYRMAWVGYAEKGKHKNVLAVAHAGFEDGYLDKARITWADTPLGQGPTGTAIRTGESCIMRDIHNNPLFQSWREEAVKRGYTSVQSLPLKTDHEIFGAITIYSEIPFAFNAKETELLKALADNLAFGITTLRNRKAHEEVENQNRKLSVAIERSSVIFIVTDSQGNIEYTNPRFTEVTGYTDEEVRGKNPRILKSGLMPLTIYQDLWQTILSGVSWRGELQNRKKNGDLYWGLAAITPIYNSGGAISSFVTVMEDITSEKKYLQELSDAKEKAEESDRLKSAFLANISHEIRTPMNGILGFSELLKEPQLSSKDQSEYIDLIQQSGRRMLNLISDLVDISRIDAKETTLQITKTPLNTLLLDLQTLFSLEAQKKGLRLHCSPGLSDSESIIETDSDKLRQILSNLIQNALKFTTKGGIDFGYTRKENTLEFYCIDSGIGLPVENREKIFDRFHQINTTLTRNHEGSGLGLSISRAFVQLLGGTLTVNSIEGAGSTFTFTLPYTPSC